MLFTVCDVVCLHMTNGLANPDMSLLFHHLTVFENLDSLSSLYALQFFLIKVDIHPTTLFGLESFLFTD